jgi:hypothetical protein
VTREELGGGAGWGPLGLVCRRESSELDVPEWQELAGDRLGWRKMLKSIKIRT